ncbi:hypothetical protein HY969_04810 [Candidatus Kaiserbacteria bacterium]|nr:hypothetical protein [Candidatus Kaiserbacteria bacterium]
MNVTAIRAGIILLSYILAYYLSWHVGALYFSVFPGLLGGGFFPDDAARSFIGIPIALVVFVAFCITFLGGKHKYWWIGISLIPAILFEIVIDPLHIYFPIILGLIAWGLATIAHKTLKKYAPGLIG